MYISDIDASARKMIKTAFAYLLISLFCILFGVVYELFSHEVYSYYMVYAFAFPLAGGTLPFLAIFLFRRKNYPGAVAENLYHSGIATLTVGSIMRGALDIYGTTNRLLNVYWIIGTVLVAAGVTAYFAIMKIIK